MVSLPDGQGVVITGSANYYGTPKIPTISQFHPQNRSWTIWEQNLKWPRNSHSSFVIPESMASCKKPGFMDAPKNWWGSLYQILQKLVGQQS